MERVYRGIVWKGSGPPKLFWGRQGQRPQEQRVKLPAISGMLKQRLQSYYFITKFSKLLSYNKVFKVTMFSGFFSLKITPSFIIFAIW